MVLGITPPTDRVCSVVPKPLPPLRLHHTHLHGDRREDWVVPAYGRADFLVLGTCVAYGVEFGRRGEHGSSEPHGEALHVVRTACDGEVKGSGSTIHTTANQEESWQDAAWALRPPGDEMSGTVERASHGRRLHDVDIDRCWLDAST